MKNNLEYSDLLKHFWGNIKKLPLEKKIEAECCMINHVMGDKKALLEKKGLRA